MKNVYSLSRTTLVKSFFLTIERTLSDGMKLGWTDSVPPLYLTCEFDFKNQAGFECKYIPRFKCNLIISIPNISHQQQGRNPFMSHFRD